MFESVDWQSAQHPDRVYRVLLGSDTVVNAWDGNQLAVLTRIIDDGEMLAYIHWVLVIPKYQGMHVDKDSSNASRSSMPTTCSLK